MDDMDGMDLMDSTTGFKRLRVLFISSVVSIMSILFFGCGGTSERVVVYSPHGAEMLGDYERLFEAAYPEVDLQWLDMGPQEIFSRVSAERQRPAGDVWWGGAIVHV